MPSSFNVQDLPERTIPVRLAVVREERLLEPEPVKMFALKMSPFCVNVRLEISMMESVAKFTVPSLVKAPVTVRLPLKAIEVEAPLMLMEPAVTLASITTEDPP